MRINDGLPAAEHSASAKYWAAEGGQRVVHAATHLHGGVGVDRDYPLHSVFQRSLDTCAMNAIHKFIAQIQSTLALPYAGYSRSGIARGWGLSSKSAPGADLLR
jgi:alkylation response protein AidB-like acyl-CoA dehydrogenase